MSIVDREAVIYWSRDAILKTIETFLPVWIIDQLPEDVLNIVRETETVITDTQLKLLLKRLKETVMDRVLTIPIFEDFCKIFDELKRHPALPKVIGLEGCMNHMPSSPISPIDREEVVLKTTSEHIVSITLFLFDRYMKKVPNLPRCTKYLAFFEADKHVKELEDHELIHLHKKKLNENLIELFDPLMAAFQKNPDKHKSRTCQDKLDKLARRTLWFDESDYWLIPEFRYMFDFERSCYPNKQFTDEQEFEMFECKQFFQVFFSQISDIMPFHKSGKKLASFSHEPYLMHHVFTQTKIFSKSFLLYMKKSIDENETSDDSNLVKEVYPESGPHEALHMIRANQGDEVMSRYLKNKKLPKPILMKLTDVSMYFPIVSPEGQLCMDIFQASKIWKAQFFSFNMNTDDFIKERFEDVREYINESLNHFKIHIENSTAICYDTVQQLMARWNAITKKYYWKRDNRLIFGPPNSRSKNELIKLLTCTWAGHLYPVFPEAYADSIATERAPPNFFNFLHMSFLATFPKAAIQLHKMGACHTLQMKKTDDRNICCALDLVFDPELKKMETRCDVPIKSQIVKSILKTYETLKTEQNRAEAPSNGLKKGFLNKPSALKIEENKEAILSEDQAGTVPIRREEIHPSFDKDEIPGFMFLNCLKMLMFKKSFDGLPEKIVKPLSQPNYIFDLKKFEKLMKQVKLDSTMMYVDSMKELLKNVEVLIKSIGLPMISTGVECLNFCMKQSNPIYVGPKQHLLIHICSFINSRRKFDIHLILQKLYLNEAAAKMKYFEMVEVNINDLEEECTAIMDKILKPITKKDVTMSGLHAIVSEFMKNSTDQDFYNKVANYVLGNTNYPNNQFIKAKILETMEKGAENTKDIQQFAICLILGAKRAKQLAEECAELIWLKSYKDLDNDELPQGTFLPVVHFGDFDNEAASVLKTTDTLVFCEHIKMYIMVATKHQSKEDLKFLKDTTKVFHYQYHHYAGSILDENIENHKPRIQFISEPAIGRNTCPPLVSPINTLCKPAHFILVDFYNFLYYELNIFWSIKKEYIEDVTIYVSKFCDKFALPQKEKYCYCWNTFCEFLDEGRQFFENKLNVLKNDRLPGNVVAAVFKECYKSDSTPSTYKRIFLCLLKNFPPMCLIAHHHSRCQNFGFCVLSLVPGSDEAEHCIEKAHKYDLGIHSANSSYKTYEVPGVHVLNALRSIMFPTAFKNLPTKFTDPLRHPDYFLKLTAIDTFLRLNAIYFEPYENNMCMISSPFSNYHQFPDCRSRNEMSESVTCLVLSRGIYRLCDNMEVAIIKNVMGQVKIDCKKPLLPSIFFDIAKEGAKAELQFMQNPLGAKIMQFEFQKIAHQMKNNEDVSIRVTDLVKACILEKHDMNELLSNMKKEQAVAWKKISKEPNVDAMIAKFVKLVFETYDYPFKAAIVTELTSLVMESNRQVELLHEQLAIFIRMKLKAKQYWKQLSDTYTSSFWEVSSKFLPDPFLEVHFIKPADLNRDNSTRRSFEETHGHRYFAFCRDVELVIMLTMKQRNMYIRKKHGSNLLEKDTAKIFNYYSYTRVIDIMLNVCGVEHSNYRSTVTNIFGYNTCPPLVSPINTLCKPSEIILTDFFNVLNYDLKVFGSLKEECFNDFHAIIGEFCKEMEYTRETQFCISMDCFNGFMAKKRPVFATMLDHDLKKMTVLNDQEYDGETVISLLTSNAKPGLLRGYVLLLQCAVDGISTNKPNWVKLADDLLFRSFVVQYPQLCFLMHTQKKCTEFWNDCLLHLHGQPGPYCSITEKNHSYVDFEKRFAALLKEKPSVKKTRKPKPKPIKKVKVAEKTEDSRGSSEEVEEKTSRKASVSCAPEVVEISTANAAEVVPQMQSIIPEEKVDKVLYNENIISKCLELFCDDSILEWMRSRKYYRLPEGWVEFEEVKKALEKFSGALGTSLDIILEDMQQIRQLPGAAMFFEMGTERIDFKNSNRHKMSKEVRKTSDFKQNWLKSLKISENFYQKDNGVFEALIQHQLDSLALKLESCEIVTLKWPKIDLEDMMFELKMKMKENRKEEAINFVKVHREILDKLATVDEKINYLITISSATDKVPDCYHNEMVDLLENFKLATNGEKWMWNILARKMKEEEFEKLKEIHKEHINKMGKDDDKIDYLICVLSETNQNKLAELLKKTRDHWIDVLLFKIHKAKRAVETLCKIDEYGITRKFDKDSMNHIPIIRSVRNDTIVFVSELRMSFEVAHRLRNDGVELNEVLLPKDDDSGVETFGYVSKEQLEIISTNEGFYELPFEVICSDQVTLKSDVIIPMSSPKNTLCVKAGVSLKQVLRSMVMEKVFTRLKSIDINMLTSHVNLLCQYFKPAISSTFCLDYYLSKQLVDLTKAQFDGLQKHVETNYEPNTDIKKFIEMESEMRVFPSFEVMLTSLLSDYESLPAKNTLAEILGIADIRTFMFEYHQLAIVYHNQKLCSVTGKKPFCSISLIEGDNLGYDIPAKCNISNIGHVEEFKKMMKERNMTRLSGEAMQDDYEAENVKEEDDNVKDDEAEFRDIEKASVSCESSQEIGEVESSDSIENIAVEKLDSSSDEESDCEEVEGEKNIVDTKPKEEERVLNKTSEETNTDEMSESASSEESDLEELAEKNGKTEDLRRNEDHIEQIEPFDAASFIESSSSTFIVTNSRTKLSEISTSKNPNPFSNSSDISQIFAPVYRPTPSNPTNISDRPSTSGSSDRSRFQEPQLRRLPSARPKPTHLPGFDNWSSRKDRKLVQENQILKGEIEALSWQLIQANGKMDELKKKYEAQKPEAIDIEYYKKYNERGEIMRDAATQKLEKYKSVLTDIDMTQARRELDNFKMDYDFYTTKALKNINILMANPNTPVDSLYKLVEWPEVFSGTTIGKMKKYCFICTEEMYEDQKLFNCVQCVAEAHYSCYEKCPTTK